MSTEESGNFTLTMSDQLGKIVLQETLNNFSTRGQRFKLDMSAYENGLYTLILEGEHINATKKGFIIKQITIS